MQDSLVVVLLEAEGTRRAGHQLRQDGAVGHLDRRHGDGLAVVAGHAAQLQVGLLHAFFEREIKMFADGPAVAGDHFEIVHHLLSLIGKGGTGLAAVPVDEDRGQLQHRLGMEVPLGIRDGEIHRDLVPDEGEDLGRAVDADLVGKLHLLGDGFGTRYGRQDGGAKENDFKGIFHHSAL